jgi:hypothetical protein
MTSSSQLIPALSGARGKAKGRFGIAFGRRFFLLLLVGLIWIGPMWTDAKYILGMVLWDVAVLVLWGLDLKRLPKPEEIEVRRLWQSTPQLGEPAEVTLQFINRGKSNIWLRAQEEILVGLRKEIPELELRVAGGESQSTN